MATKRLDDRSARHDRFHQKAKKEGFLARAVYKLQEIDEKHKIFEPGHTRVLDLGCAPGSWLQVATRLTGPRGRVVGVDLQEVDPDAVRHGMDRPTADAVTAIQADVFAVDPARLLELSGGPFDVVLSDMAPNTSGHGDDHLSARLCRRVLELLPGLLRRGGTLCMKVLEGEAFPELLRDTKGLFRECGATKPKASREVSREMYIVGSGYRG